MKAKALQFGKAMSAALFVLLLVVVGSKNALAQTQVATLQHGDDVSVFYGQNAFVEAHDAAATGDIITLSSGTFVPTTITKAITLRGAGCAVDTVAHTNPTIFGGNITLNVADTDNFLTIEGILFTNSVIYKTLYNPKFNRCDFTEITYEDYNYHDEMHNAQFVNCIINSFYFFQSRATVLINSVVWQSDGLNVNETAVVLYNSIIHVKQADNLSANNSIIIRTDSYYGPYSTCSFVNCIGIYTGTGNGTAFGSVNQSGYTTGCINYTSYEEVFESFRGDFSLEELFILKDEIATGFLGTDGTQAGIYGGFMPYSNRPTYMVMKHCNVANKSTIDGKLSVDIEVVTEE